MLKAKELRDQSLEELSATSSDLYAKMFKLNNMRKGAKDLKQSGEFRNARKDLARVLTIRTEKLTEMKRAS